MKRFVMLAALLVTPVVAVVRARRRRRAGGERAARPVAVRAAFALVVVTAMAWTVAAILTALDPGTPGRLGPAWLALVALAIASVPGAAMLAWDAAVGWRARGPAARIATTAVAAAAVALAWLYVAYGFVTPTTTF